MAEERNALICAPTSWGAREKMAAGSIEATCVDCGQSVWIAPTGQRLREQHDAEVLCVTCGLASLKENPDSEIAPLSPDQLREITRELRRPPI